MKISRALSKAPKKIGGDSSSSTSSTGAEKSYHVKLPKYVVEKFAGDPKRYRTFRDLFEVAVMNNEKLSNVEKFTYLMGYVEGKAKAAIEGLPVTERTFLEAIQILDNRFGNKQAIVSSHMEELVKIPPVKDKGDTKGLRDLADQVETHLRCLRTMEVDPETHGLLLVPLLKRKLPASVNLLLSRKFNSNDELWKIDDIMRELKSEVEARERSITEVDEFKEKEKKKVPKFQSTVEGLLGQAHGRLTCPFCEKGHFPDKCRLVTDPEKR